MKRVTLVYVSKLRRPGFVSYAHADAVLVERFLDLMRPRCANLRELELDIWSDRRILVGGRWQDEIAAAIAATGCGLLCITPNLLDSDYVTVVELPPLLRAGVVFPVALEPIDFRRSDLRGLQELQIFHLRRRGSTERRAFSECAGPNRGRFCNALVGEIADRLLGGGR